MRRPLLLPIVLALAVAVVGARAWIGAGGTAREELSQRGLGVADVLAAALRESRDRGRQAEGRERLRLGTAARRIRTELAQPQGPAVPRLERIVGEEHLGRVFLFDREGQRGPRVAAPSGWLLGPGDAGEPAGGADPRAEAEWRRAAQAVAPLLSGERELVDPGLSANVYGTTYRVGVGVRLGDGGAAWVESDAEDVAALQRGADLGRVLEEACRLPDVRAARVVRGEEVVAQARAAGAPEDGEILPFVRTLALEGEGALQVAVDLSTARSDRLTAAERRGILLWIGLAGGGALLGAGLLWRGARRAEREERQLRSHLSEERRLAEMGVLTGLFVHEISNPLNALGLHLAALERTAGEAGAETTAKMRRTLARTRTALEGFLNLGTPVEPAAGPLYGVPILRRAVSELAAEHAGVTLRLEVEPRAEGWRVPVREALLDQAVRNVLRNAIEASPAAGRIDVRWSATGAARVALEVTDQGPGFPADVLAEGPSLGRTGRRGGHGLGLYLARRAVEAAGGRLALGNRSEGGARVVLDLPLAGAGSTA